MDIKELKAEFEKLKYIEEKLEYLNFDEHLDCYVEKSNGMPVGLAAWVNGAFYGFNQAAKAQAVPKWISVKDKLPSDDIGRVLAWVVEQNSLGKCGFVWNCSHSNGVFSDKFETFQLTHWMPLPDAPQEPAND